MDKDELEGGLGMGKGTEMTRKEKSEERLLKARSGRRDRDNCMLLGSEFQT